MSEKTLIDRIVLADEQGHLQGKPLESVRGAVAEAVPPAVAAEVAKLPKPTAEITPAVLAKEMGVWIVYGGTEPEPTKYGVNVVWVDTLNPNAHVPAAPVFSQQAKTIEIPADLGVTYRIDGTPVEAGTSRVTEPFPKTVRVSAIAKSGFTLAVGTQTEWSFTFESVAIPYEDAVLPLTTYLRLDDAPGATVPRDSGTSPLTISTKFGGVFTPGAPGIGIGATSARVTAAASIVAQFNPSDIRAYTVVSVHKINREHTQLVTLASLWSTSMPSLTVLTAKGAGTNATVNFQNTGGAKTTTVNPTPALADGDIVVMVQTWDGTTIHGYVNGIEVVSVPWAGSTSTNDALKLVSWSAPGGGEISIAGIGFQKGEAKSSEWVSAAYEAAKRGAAV